MMAMIAMNTSITMMTLMTMMTMMNMGMDENGRTQIKVDEMDENGYKWVNMKLGKKGLKIDKIG